MSRRPGGLTALAVLNFVFGGLKALGIVTIVGLLGLANQASDGALTDALNENPDVPALGVLYLMLLLSVVGAALLLASGVGYLQQKKFLGRTLGNTYAVLSIGSSVLDIALGEGVSIIVLVFLIYPVLTLILLNTTFKEDFIR